MERIDSDDTRWKGLSEDLAELSGGISTDWYDSSVVGEGMVSIEAAAHLEFDLKKTLDDQIDGENIHNEGEVKNGLPPCIRAKKSF